MDKKENVSLTDLHLRSLNLRKARFQTELEVIGTKEIPVSKDEKLSVEQARWQNVGKLEMDAADIEIEFMKAYKSKILEKGLMVPGTNVPQMTKADNCWPSCTDCVTGCTICVTDCVKCVSNCTECVTDCIQCITDPN